MEITGGWKTTHLPWHKAAFAPKVDCRSSNVLYFPGSQHRADSSALVSKFMHEEHLSDRSSGTGTTIASVKALPEMGQVLPQSPPLRSRVCVFVSKNTNSNNCPCPTNIGPYSFIRVRVLSLDFLSQGFASRLLASVCLAARGTPIFLGQALSAEPSCVRIKVYTSCCAAGLF